MAAIVQMKNNHCTSLWHTSFPICFSITESKCLSVQSLKQGLSKLEKTEPIVEKISDVFIHFHSIPYTLRAIYYYSY